MRKSLSAPIILATIALSSTGYSQVSRLSEPSSRKRPAHTSSAKENILTIKKVYGVGNRAKILTPTYTTSIPRGVNPARTWGKIEVLYETNRTKDDWIDELTFHYYALARTVDKGKPAYSFYKVNVHYVDIQAGARPILHRSVVYLRPTAILRYGELEAVAVEIRHAGEVIAAATDISPGAKLPSGEWWTNPVVTESPITTLRTGYLLDREHSPFALVNIDDYEVIK